jgi:2-polyprenyl-6-methoxyphenol hydroxylase-like FAD-dependent oxidoreductase
MSFSPKIAIIGAGPGGLTLATLLQRNRIPYTVYESESGPDVRNQGGTLDLHRDSGQLALREAGLTEEFRKKSRPEGEALKLVSPTGKVLRDENDSSTPSRPEDFADRPEIDRVVLRDILLNSLEPNNIRWGKKLQHVEPGEDSTYDLYFGSSSVEKGFDLVVGADGAWSKVRPLLTDQKPVYSGISMVELWALDAETRHPWLSEYVGAGSCFMFDEGRALFCQRNGNGSIRSYACVRQPETWTTDCGIDWTAPEAARNELADRYFGDCADDLKRVILESRDELIPRCLYMLPVGITWAPRAGITLLGDAAHLMTPFAGVGVNVAMHDALELAHAVTAWKSSGASDRAGLADALGAYEAGLFERGKRNAAKTAKRMAMSFSRGGGEKMIEMAQAAGAKG